MAVVVVFCPMEVYSISAAALKNPVGIRHKVIAIVEKSIWEPNTLERSFVEGVLTACGTTIQFRLYDTETRHGKPRPTKLCDRCARSQPQDAEMFIGVSDACSSVVRELDVGTAQGTLLP
jgi:hypothetical protein